MSEQPGPVPLGDVLGLVGNPSRSVWLRRVAAETHRRTQARRARVLAHPDLAARLCEPPLSYARPDQWNGYVPPREEAEVIPELLRSPAHIASSGRATGGHPNSHGHRTGISVVNDAERRRVLVDICREAEQRARDAGQPCAADDPPLLDVIRWLPLAGDQDAMIPEPGPVAEQIPLPAEPPAPDPASWPEGSIGEQANR